MGDENHIRTLGDYSKPSHEGYRNTIELPVGNNMVPLRFDTIWTTKLCNDILMLQQHHGESLSKAWTRFKDLLQKVPHHGIDLWLQVQIFYDHVNPVTRRTIDQSANGKLRDLNPKESWAILEDLALFDNESWNNLRDFSKPVKAITLPQDVPSTSNHHLIELENQVQRLMESHLAPTQPTQVNKITTSCEICSGPHDTQIYMENPEQAFVEYASSRTDEAGCKWYTFKPEQNNLGDTYNPSWKSHSNLRWRQPQNSQNNFSNRFQPNGSILNRPFNNRPQNFNNQSSIEGLVLYNESKKIFDEDVGFRDRANVSQVGTKFTKRHGVKSDKSSYTTTMRDTIELMMVTEGDKAVTEGPNSPLVDLRALRLVYLPLMLSLSKHISIG
ncbi:hypothetical protein Tco_0662146 [Tanacetum coccineum]